MCLCVLVRVYLAQDREMRLMRRKPEHDLHASTHTQLTHAQLHTHACTHAKTQARTHARTRSARTRAHQIGVEPVDDVRRVSVVPARHLPSCGGAAERSGRGARTHAGWQRCERMKLMILCSPSPGTDESERITRSCRMHPHPPVSWSICAMCPCIYPPIKSCVCARAWPRAAPSVAVLTCASALPLFFNGFSKCFRGGGAGAHARPVGVVRDALVDVEAKRRR